MLKKIASEELKMSGLKNNLWISIQQAFQLLDANLNTEIFLIDNYNPSKNEAYLGLSEWDASDNIFDHFYSLLSLELMFKRLTGIDVPKIISLPDFFSKINNLYGEILKNNWVILHFEIDNSSYLLMRAPRNIWEKYSPVPIFSALGFDHQFNSLAETLSFISLLIYADPNRNEPFELSANELLTRAASYFLLKKAEFATSINFFDLNSLFYDIDSFSTMVYEKREPNGVVLLVPNNLKHPYFEANLDLKIQFQIPVAIEKYVAVRKIIEMTGENRAALTDGKLIYGIGWYKNIDSETTILIKITGYHKWAVFYGSQNLFNVIDGFPRLPQDRYSKEQFEADISTWKDVINVNHSSLWEIIEAALKASHGALIIISTTAEKEAQRLKAQSTLITPTKLHKDILPCVFAIDGAVLLDALGECYAIGVILDGSGTEKGDSSRGSRYNSAVRYVYTPERSAVAIVCSEDGHVDFIARDE